MPRPAAGARESLPRQARAGASYVLQDRLLLGIGGFGFGLLLTAEATGGLLGAGIASFLGRRLGTGTALTCTATVEGLAVLGLAAAPNRYVAGLALAVCGAGMGATMVLAPLYTAGGLLLAMTAVTATMTSNRRVETALRDAASAGEPAHTDSSPH